ncbi:hypothetical protein, partial [Comamonas sp.]
MSFIVVSLEFLSQALTPIPFEGWPGLRFFSPKLDQAADLKAFFRHWGRQMEILVISSVSGSSLSVVKLV